jgi:hypothetical protein
MCGTNRENAKASLPGKYFKIRVFLPLIHFEELVLISSMNELWVSVLGRVVKRCT